MLVLVTAFVPRPWQPEVNAVLAAAARRYPDVMLADWFTTIRSRTGLLWDDGVHPRPAGAVVSARRVAAAARQAAARAGRPAPAWPPAVRSRPPGAGWQWHKLGL
jgi:lysophospholipase L1-like esterase